MDKHKNTTIHKKSFLIVKSKHGQTKNTTSQKKLSNQNRPLLSNQNTKIQPTMDAF